MKGAYQTLYTLDTKKQIIKHSILTIFILIFSIIYEYFSHGVYSVYMMYAFLIPLILGILLDILIYTFKLKVSINNIKLNNALIITLLLGSLLKGALDIYGTSNILVIGYLFICVVLIEINIILYIKGK